MKTHVLIVSRTFPKTHKRAGEETNFIDKIEIGLDIGKYCNLPFPPYDPKLHTIRGNYELWEKRIKEVQEGKAILSLRYWSGKPYNSKQFEFCQLDKDSGIGVQELIWTIDNSLNSRPMIYDSCNQIDCNNLAKNDGLSLEDFKEWFRGYDLSKPMAIIHFTDFRY